MIFFRVVFFGKVKDIFVEGNGGKLVLLLWYKELFFEGSIVVKIVFFFCLKEMWNVLVNILGEVLVIIDFKCLGELRKKFEGLWVIGCMCVL